MFKQIKLILKNSGILKSKFIYIYSDFRFFFQYEKKNQLQKVDSLIKYLTSKGSTCIVPSFSYTKKGFFNVKKTPSKIGFLSNYLLKKKNIERSNHPIFSFIAIGKNKKFLKKLGKSAFGNNSLHKNLKNNKCFYLHIDRPLYKGNTLIHHIEQKNKANYRFEKTFKTKVYKNNKFVGTNFKAFVRKDMKNKFTEGTFKKVYRTIGKKNYIYKKKINQFEICIYPYDIFYDDLNYLFKKNNKIFINN